MKAVSFVCADEIDELATEFEGRGYSRAIVGRLRDTARGLRERGCCLPVRCERCTAAPALQAAE